MVYRTGFRIANAEEAAGGVRWNVCKSRGISRGGNAWAFARGNSV